MKELHRLQVIVEVTTFLFIASAVVLMLRVLGGCSGHQAIDKGAQRANNALDAVNYDQALDVCIANAQDGGTPYSVCEAQVDAKFRRTR